MLFQKIIANNELPRMLIVDDNAQIRDMLTCFFEDQFQICTAPNGKEGLAHFMYSRFPVVLTDLNMPVMNGLEFLKKLNELPETIRPRVIAMSASTDRNELDEVRKSNGAFVQKPFDMTVLYSTVEAAWKTFQD